MMVEICHGRGTGELAMQEHERTTRGRHLNCLVSLGTSAGALRGKPKYPTLNPYQQFSVDHEANAYLQNGSVVRLRNPVHRRTYNDPNR